VKKTNGVNRSGYDYTGLSLPVQTNVALWTEEIHLLSRQTAENLILIGQHLGSVKQALPHGEFGKWLDAEFGWSDRTARKFMEVAEAFGKTEIISEFAPTALYTLASPSAPEPARLEALDRARKGEKITAAAAKEILARHKGEAPGEAADSAPGNGERDLLQALLPRPLAHLLQAGAVTAAHLRLLLPLKDAYTPSLIRPGFNIEANPSFDPLSAAMFLNSIRPEDMPPMWALWIAAGKPCPPSLVEATGVFWRDGCDRKGLLPQWEVAALWWASMVVLADLTPELLDQALRLWSERFEDALCWWMLHGEEKPEPGKWNEEARLWWAYHSDLRHGGALEYASHLQERDPDRAWKLLGTMKARETWCNPTQLLWDSLGQKAAS